MQKRTQNTILSVACTLFGVPSICMAQIAAQGPEFVVNAVLIGAQYQPAAALSGDGSAIVAWQVEHEDGEGFGVFGRRCDDVGSFIGGQFQVNEDPSREQMYPAVASNADGRFVVAWLDCGEAFGYGHIEMRFFNNAGDPVSDDLVVTNSEACANAPSVCMDAQGGVVVTWTNFGLDGSFSGIFARRFASDGTSLGEVYQVNTNTLNGQLLPAIAASPDGGSTIVWMDESGEGSGGVGIFGQRYDASGVPIGSEFHVNTTTSGEQTGPTIAHSASGGFVVAWESAPSGSSDIRYRCFEASGSPQGAEMTANTSLTWEQIDPSVAVDTEGNIVISWTSGENASYSDVHMRRFDPSGQPVSPVIVANEHAEQTQSHSTILFGNDGYLVNVWSSYGQDSPIGEGIYCRRFIDCSFKSPITISSISQTDILCFGASTGTLTVEAAGGSGGLVWSINGEPAQALGTASGLSAGTYSIVVQDSLFCTASDQATLSTNAELTLSSIELDTAMGILTLVASGGVPPYSFSIDNGETFPNTTGIFEGVWSGVYYMRLMDAAGCVVALGSIEVPVTIQEEEGTMPRLIVFPQPANGRLNLLVQGASDSIRTIDLFTADARLVKHLRSNGTSRPTTVEVEGFDAGLYVLVVRFSKGTITSTPVVIEGR